MDLGSAILLSLGGGDEDEGVPPQPQQGDEDAGGGADGRHHALQQALLPLLHQQHPRRPGRERERSPLFLRSRKHSLIIYCFFITFFVKKTGTGSYL
jgi:hypothetical protein